MGRLYYSSAFSDDSEGDLKIIYYKLKTKNKLSVIGEKKGNQIVPKKDLNGYQNIEVFKSSGDEYRINDFIEMLKNESHTLYMVFLVISIIIFIIAIAFFACGCLLK